MPINKLPKRLRRAGELATVHVLPVPAFVVAVGQQWLITKAKAPWQQHEDLTLTVQDVYRLSEAELKPYDVVTQDALRGVEYAVMTGEDVAGIQLPTELLEEIGERLVPDRGRVK